MTENQEEELPELSADELECGAGGVIIGIGRNGDEWPSNPFGASRHKINKRKASKRRR